MDLEYYVLFAFLLFSLLLCISLLGLRLLENRLHKRQVGPFGVRPLSITEFQHASREFILTGNCNISMLLETSEEIDVSLLSKSLKAIQADYAALQSQIVNDYVYRDRLKQMKHAHYEIVQPAPSIHCDVIKDFDQSPTEILELELNRAFEAQNALFRCTVVPNKKLNYIVFTIDKRISDGIHLSMNIIDRCQGNGLVHLVNQTMQIYKTSKDQKKYPVVNSSIKYTISEPIDKLLPNEFGVTMIIKAFWRLFRQTRLKSQSVALFRGLADKNIAEQQRKKFDRKSNRTNHKTMVFNLNLSVESTRAIIKQSKENGFSIEETIMGSIFEGGSKYLRDNHVTGVKLYGYYMQDLRKYSSVQEPAQWNSPSIVGPWDKSSDPILNKIKNLEMLRSRDEVLRFLVFDTNFVNYYSYIKDWVEYGRVMRPLPFFSYSHFGTIEVPIDCKKVGMAIGSGFPMPVVNVTSVIVDEKLEIGFSVADSMSKHGFETLCKEIVSQLNKGF